MAAAHRRADAAVSCIGPIVRKTLCYTITALNVLQEALAFHLVLSTTNYFAGPAWGTLVLLGDVGLHLASDRTLSTHVISPQIKEIHK